MPAPAEGAPAGSGRDRFSDDLRAEAERQRPRELGHIDGPLTMLTLLLLLMGLVVLFSASYAVAYRDFGDYTHYFTRQAIFAVAGVAVMLVLSKFNYHKLHYLAIPALIAAVVLLATIKIPGLKSYWVTRNEATRWIELPGLGQFQPSELAKVAVILCFSSVATIFGEKKMRTLRWGIIPFVAVLGVLALEMYWEKHLSGTVIIFLVGMLIVYVGGGRFAYLLGGGLAGVAAAVVYILKKGYAMTRFEVWLHPFENFQGKGWQGGNSLIAIGSGGFWGLGLGQGRQKHLYLPEPANDFIFSAACEELGFVGGLLILLVFAALVWRGYYIALHANDKFGTLLAAGITTQIAIQVAINLFVVTGLMPVTGASLPFFSYGGTALLIQLAEMGILLAVSRKMPAPEEG